MGILDMLLEKKDLRIFIEQRIKMLSKQRKAEAKKAEPKLRGLIYERFNGRIAELKYLKRLLASNRIKEMDKEMWQLNEG